MLPLQTATAGPPSGGSRSFGHRRSSASRARLGRLFDAPHRLGFFAGALMMALLALWWGVALLARHAGLLLPWAVAPSTAHGLAMGFGFMPLFFTGFLFTAGPRWLGLEPVPAARLAVPVAVMLGGWALALAGFHFSSALAALGLGAAAMGLALATGLFGLMLLDSRERQPELDRDHAWLVLLGCLVCVLAVWTAAVAVALGRDGIARAALQGGLWAGLCLVFVVVAHRMIPFFSSAALPALDAWRPRALLGLLAGLVLLQAPLAAAEALLGVDLPLPLLAVRAVLELCGGALLLWLALRWGLRQSLGHGPAMRLLAMLHLGFFWLGLAFVLGAASHGLMLASEGRLSLGLAPLHALTMGYLGSTLLAMATRVAAGHSGRTLAADNWAWMMFWVLQVGIAARLAAALWPAMATPLTLFAAQCWLAALGAWALRYGRWFLRPRADGRPG
ncbi:MAG: NnrS family protein [Burkholderiaceae bacterium]|nr:NnrS family protein [Burkholderiaceae bacterium]